MKPTASIWCLRCSRSRATSGTGEASELSRVPLRVLMWLSLALALAMCGGARAETRMSQLLPKAAKAALIVDDMSAFEENFVDTQIAALADDPTVEPFADDVRRYLQGRVAGLEADLGVTASEVSDLAQGPLGAAIVGASDGSPARMLLVDASDVKRARELMATAGQRFQRQGRQSERLQMGDVTLHVHRTADKVAVCFLRDNLLGIADDLGAARACVARLTGEADDSLSSLPAYQNGLRRLQASAQGKPPHVRWFLEPVGLAQLLHTPELGEDEEDEPLAIAARHGADVVSGISGFVNFSSDDYDAVYRIAITAKPPYRRTMAMFRFANSRDFAPPDWVPDHVSSFTTFHWNVARIGLHVGPLFDDLVDEEEGTYDGLLEDLKTDPDGPQIDVQQQVMEQIGPRIHHMSAFVQPVDATSEFSVLAIESKNDKELSLTLEQLMGDDPSVEPLDAEEAFGRAFRDRWMWRLGEDSVELEDEEKKIAFTSSALMAGLGHMLIGSNYQRTVEFLQGLRGASPLAQASDFRNINQRLNDLGGEEAFVRVFARLEQDFYTTYELMRRGQLEKAESIYAQLITLLLDPEDEDADIDYAKLPAFEQVGRYLGYTGIYAVSQGGRLVGCRILAAGRALSTAGQQETRITQKYRKRTAATVIPHTMSMILLSRIGWPALLLTWAGLCCPALGQQSPQRDHVALRLADLRTAAQQLEQWLAPQGANGEAWLRYLQWDRLRAELRGGGDPDLEQLDQVAARLAADHVGLELARFRNLHVAVHRYAEAIRHRQRGSLPNFRITLSQPVVSTSTEEEIDDASPVTDNILGTAIYGDGRTRGTARMHFVASDEHGALELRLAAKLTTDTTGYNGPVRIYSAGQTWISARKRVHIDATGIRAAPATASATNKIRTKGISSKFRCRLLDGLVRRVAWKRLRKQKSLSDHIAAQHAARDFKQQLDDELAEMLAKANADFQQEIRQPLLDGEAFPRLLQVSTTADQLQVAILQATGEQLGAPAGSPHELQRGDLTLELHASAVNNLTASMLAGVTLTDLEIQQELHELGLLDEITAKPGKDAIAITLADQDPVSVHIDKGQIALTVRGKRYIAGGRSYPPMNVSIRYHIERLENRLVAKLDGEPEFVPPRFASGGRRRLGLREIALKNLLKKRLDRELDPEVVSDGFVLPEPGDRLGKFSYRQLVADEGWLLMVCQLPD